MSRCSEPNCNKVVHLSLFIFYDPHNHLTQNIYRCQQHSDFTLAKFVESYEKINETIEYLKKQRLAERGRNNIYDVKPEYSVTDKIQKLYSIKNKISNYQCRSNICSNEITKRQLRFECTVLHANGNFRHYLYFCSLKCMNTLKAQTGVSVPILVGQRSLPGFSV